MNSLIGKQIVLGITGSIAAYKSPDIVRRLKDAGALVRVVMTEHAKQFITPLTLQAVSGYPVHDDLFDLAAEAAMGHIELARWADLVLIAPASANLMANLIQGQAHDLLTTLCLATRANIALAPAMNQAMWLHPVTQSNRHRLAEQGVCFIGPDQGSQACGDNGPGRMMEPQAILDTVSQLFSTDSLAGCHLVMTAGPTREAIDPIRYLTNKSSGKMGYALAAAAIDAGARVTLISGPTSLTAPRKVDLISVVSTQQMYSAVMQQASQCDIFCGVAAVADYKMEHIAAQKISKTKDKLHLELVKNPDIISEVSALPNPPFIVGFAAETENVIHRAKEKLIRKKMNMIIANEVSENKGMESEDNEVSVITKDEHIHLPLMSKTKCAKELIKLISENWRKQYA